MKAAGSVRWEGHDGPVSESDPDQGVPEVAQMVRDRLGVLATALATARGAHQQIAAALAPFVAAYGASHPVPCAHPSGWSLIRVDPDDTLVHLEHDCYLAHRSPVGGRTHRRVPLDELLTVPTP